MQNAPSVQWSQGGQPKAALWRSERGATAPKRVIVVPNRIVNVVI